MIYGVGTDIVAIARMADLYRRHGERALEKLLAPAERQACREATLPARFLAKRFAAKEALGKALGSGVRAPVLLPAIAVGHSAAGQPFFEYAEALAAHLQRLGLSAHLSLSDEAELALAFVVVEKK